MTEECWDDVQSDFAPVSVEPQLSRGRGSRGGSFNSEGSYGRGGSRGNYSGEVRGGSYGGSRGGGSRGFQDRGGRSSYGGGEFRGGRGGYRANNDNDDFGNGFRGGRGGGNNDEGRGFGRGSRGGRGSWNDDERGSGSRGRFVGGGRGSRGRFDANDECDNRGGSYGSGRGSNYIRGSGGNFGRENNERDRNYGGNFGRENNERDRNYGGRSDNQSAGYNNNRFDDSSNRPPRGSGRGSYRGSQVGGEDRDYSHASRGRGGFNALLHCYRGSSNLEDHGPIEDFSSKCNISDSRGSSRGQHTYNTRVYENSNMRTETSNEGFDRYHDNAGNVESGEAAKPPITYIPPEFDENEQSLFNRGVRTGINFDRYDSVKVSVTGGDDHADPIQSFGSLDVEPVLLENIKRCDYSRPTPVQKYAMPLLLKYHDLMACAQTGSGKTAAFVIPILNRILTENLVGECVPDDRYRVCMPVALVVVPTRELVLQTFAECKKFSFGTRIKTTQIYGGVSVQYQLGQLRNGCEIVVGTTGRLLDVIRRGALCLQNCVMLILDEADRMLDMGFEPDIREIIRSGKIPTERCTAMFSATFPKEVQTLAQDFLRPKYSFITVGVVGGACQDVEQQVIEVSRNDKRAKLKEILSQLGQTKTLIFVEQKRFADFLASDLNQTGFSTTSIHGERLQREREDALRDFIKGDVLYLVATSVAARGLDIPGVDNVINYDLPDCITEYVHRIGRTGRCGNVGKSISFYDRDDDRCMRIAAPLVTVLKDAKQVVPDFLSGQYMGGHDLLRNEGARQDMRSTANFRHREQQRDTVEPMTKAPTYEDAWD